MQWYELNPERFAVEKLLLAQHHKGARIIIEKGKIRVEKPYHTRKACYNIRANFSKEHPYSPMIVHVTEPRIKGSPPHYFVGGRLCLHASNNVGPETTAKVYLDWAQQWIDYYEVWCETGIWPETNQKC